MAQHTETAEHSNDFEAFDAVAPDALPQDWMNAEAPVSVADSPSLQVIGTIPKFFEAPSSLPSPKKGRVILKAISKATVYASLFGLGFLCSTNINGRKNAELNQSRDAIAQEDSTALNDDSPLQGIVVDSSVFTGSLNFDDVAGSEEYDDLYGSRFQSSGLAAPIASDSYPAYTEDSSEDAFPTWADLAPQTQSEEQPSQETGFASYAAPNAYGESFDAEKKFAEADDESSRQPAFVSDSSDSFFSQNDASDNQGFQNFQAFSTTVRSEDANKYDYNDKTNYSEQSIVKDDVRATKSVDGYRNSDYNTNRRDDATDSYNDEQLSFAQLEASTASDYEAENQGDRNAEVANGGFREYASAPTQEAQQKPTYASSIPTFDNPRPRSDASRKAYVAQTYDEVSTPSEPQTKPSRSVRW